VNEEKEWVSDGASREVVDAALRRIDEKNATLPTCAVCGQRCNRLDKFGACSNTSEPHRVHRVEMQAGVIA
jgi:hypothetical protein